MVGIGMGMRLEVAPKLEVKQTLTIEYSIRENTLCPQCQHRFDPRTETGWSDNPKDCTITCPQCKHQFEGSLIVEPRVEHQSPVVHQGSFRYFCPSQTLFEMRNILRNRRRIGEQYLHTHHPDIYFSMIRHFGAYHQARKQVHLN